ncbi:MAG: 50S ribosomal protein L25 [Pirellulaceae bacterium]
MSSETLEVKKRDRLGSLASKKLRQSGSIPANLYGHGESNENLSVSSDAIQNIIKHGTKLLSLTGDVNDTAILREVQWDAFGVDVLHVDLTRVSQAEAVEVTLPVHLHGEAPGSSQGGMLTFNLHELTIRCPAARIPEHIEVNISKLNVGDSIHAAEVPLPDGATMVTAADQVVVQVSKPSGATAADFASEPTEPEVIGKSAESQDEEG